MGQDNPEWYEEMYCKAEPWLNIISEDPESIPRTKYDRDVTSQKKKIADMEEQLRLVQEYIRKKG